MSAKSQMASEYAGLQKNWFMTYPTPTNWYDDAALQNFAELTLNSNDLSTSLTQATQIIVAELLVAGDCGQ